MRATLTLPSGRKAQTRSNRRYAVVHEHEHGTPVVLRTDNIKTAETKARTWNAGSMLRQSQRLSSGGFMHVYDTVTRQRIFGPGGKVQL